MVLYSYSTKDLSRRYRHLFKLPTFPVLALILALSNAILFTLLSNVNEVPPFTVGAAFLSVFATATILAIVIHAIDNSSIVSTRRIFAVFFVTSALWLIIYSVGIGYSTLIRSTHASVNAFILGGFLAATIELLVINGAFLQDTLPSLALALLHPSIIFLLIYSKISLFDHVFPVAIGTTMILTILFFLIRVKRFETQRHAIPSLRLLQSFLKTWTSKNPKELEQYFMVYSQSQETITTIMKFVAPNKQIILVLPDIHPGPFYPVGSYNLSEAVHSQLRLNGSIPLVLHGTGGHERNLPSNYYTNQYAHQLRKFVDALAINSTVYDVRGPLRTTLGQTAITCIAFNNEVLIMVSNAPYNSDDLDPIILQDITTAAEDTGFRVSVIDAHNSIGGSDAPSLMATRKDWLNMFEKLTHLGTHKLKIGYAHSSEVEFTPAVDLSEGGIGTLVFDTDASKDVLIVADSNNIVAGLRERIIQDLKDRGFQLMEFCTSDTHNLAARSLVERGYFALGEATPTDKVIDVVSRLVNLANSRITRCDLSVANFSIDMPLMGKESLEDFAAVTNESFAFSKTFAKTVIPLILALITITIIT